MVKRSINGQQRMNGRMLPKRFERLEIDTTRLLTAEATQSVKTVQDTHKKEYKAHVVIGVKIISAVLCLLFCLIGVVLLLVYAFTPDHASNEQYVKPNTSQKDPNILISGGVFMALALIAFWVNFVSTDKDKDPNTAKTEKEEDA
jgi:multisubunit Na+/H+ antiporter MnhB subunit